MQKRKACEEEDWITALGSAVWIYPDLIEPAVDAEQVEHRQ